MKVLKGLLKHAFLGPIPLRFGLMIDWFCVCGHHQEGVFVQMFKAVQQIETKRRIALTGHPLMNKLDEYWTMIGWVRLPIPLLLYRSAC